MGGDRQRRVVGAVEREAAQLGRLDGEQQGVGQIVGEEIERAAREVGGAERLAVDVLVELLGMASGSGRRASCRRKVISGMIELQTSCSDLRPTLIGRFSLPTSEAQARS